MSVCSNCVSGHIHEGTPKGSVQEINGLSVYVSNPPSSTTPKAALIFISDILGWELPNTRLVADEYAQQGFKVYLPDFFQGDSLPGWTVPSLAPWPEQSAQKSFFVAGKDTASAMALFGPWSLKHRDAVVRPLINGFVDYIKTNPQTVGTPKGKIGAVGFCWGGRHAVLLANGSADHWVDAVVALHPSGISVPSELEPVTKPTAILAGEIDTMFDAKAATQVKELFQEKAPSVPTHVEIFPEMVHGWSNRGDMTNQKTKEGKEKAHEVSLHWFEKYLA